MTFDRFHTHILLRIVLIALSIFLCFYLFLVHHFYLSTCFVFVLVLVQIYGLFRYLRKNHLAISSFFESISFDDYSQSFRKTHNNAALDRLYQSITQTGNQLKKLRREAEEYRQFLNYVIQHIHIGIMAFDEDGEIALLNQSAKRLLQVNSLVHIDELPAVYAPLKETLRKLENDKQALIHIRKDDEVQELAVYLSTFRMQNQVMKLVSIQDIEKELSDKELDSWGNMMRVLTHEIMNSITPISSLTSSLNEMLEQDALDEHLPDIRQAAKTIERRSMGLLKFVDNFRSLTRLPDPEYSIFPVQDLFGQVQSVFKEALLKNKIDFSFSVVPEKLTLCADRELIEQILINLMHNSIHALRNTPQPQIRLKAMVDEHSKVNIRVTDNGCGISAEAMDKIFIPFYTTRKDGSGIGLSLSRQIMKQHKGSIRFTSEPDKQTNFTLRFN